MKQGRIGLRVMRSAMNLQVIQRLIVQSMLAQCNTLTWLPSL